ncbi:hypothetical protein J6590_076412 [Homalodisca vitripennis]|nr:hypothetical protein J6590_076412 [Homalodisca vitripennis]
MFRSLQGILEENTCALLDGLAKIEDFVKQIEVFTICSHIRAEVVPEESKLFSASRRRLAHEVKKRKVSVATKWNNPHVCDGRLASIEIQSAFDFN